jgi:hypothetical protein
MPPSAGSSTAPSAPSSSPRSGGSLSFPPGESIDSSVAPPDEDETSGSAGDSEPPGGYVAEVLRQVGRAGYVLDRDVLVGMWRGAHVPHTVVPIRTGAAGSGWVTTDPAGSPISAEDAAAQVVEVLDGVRMAPVDPSQASGDVPAGVIAREPVGVVIRVRVRIQHAKGVPIGIFWEMYGAGARGARLSHEWMGGLPAVVVTATREDDRGVIRLWVPLPRQEGDYSLALVAANDPLEAPLAYATVKHLR